MIIEGKSSTKDVVKYLNQLSKKIKIFHIKDTNMCFFKIINKRKNI